MKTSPTGFGWIMAVGLIGLSGCGRSETVVKGVIFSVEYQRPEGGTEGFTRLNDSRAVPGGNGSWNIDAYGMLTRQYLLITRPQHPERGPEVIPVSRLVKVQFGDGGIKQVRESRPNPGH